MYHFLTFYRVPSPYNEQPVRWSGVPSTAVLADWAFPSGLTSACVWSWRAERTLARPEFVLISSLTRVWARSVCPRYSIVCSSNGSGR